MHLVQPVVLILIQELAVLLSILQAEFRWIQLLPLTLQLRALSTSQFNLQQEAFSLMLVKLLPMLSTLILQGDLISMQPYRSISTLPKLLPLTLSALTPRLPMVVLMLTLEQAGSL